MITIPCIDTESAAAAANRQAILTKPTGALGRLEALSIRLAGIQSTERPTIKAPAIVIAAASHGVADSGVSAYPSSVTAQMVANFINGGACINVLAKQTGAKLVLVDAGVHPEPPSSPALQQLGVRKGGSRNISEEPAMTSSEAQTLIKVGISKAADLINDGVDLIAIGEMGIGNTTSAAAITAAALELEPSAVTGRGTGVDEVQLEKKHKAIQQALDLHKPIATDGLEIVTALGGLEIAYLAGICLGAAQGKTAILLDGYVATSAGLIATLINPTAKDYMIAGHLSPEPGHRLQLEFLCHEPLLDLGMRLGEGSGAAMAIPIVQAAAATLSDMATFEGAGVDNR